MIVYTVITNQKDRLLNQPVDPEATYICFSDRPFKHHQWQFRPIEVLGLGDPRRVARRYKLLSHIYFPEEDTIWIDGRVRLNITPSELMEKYKGNICMRPHPSRKCIYEEGKEVVRINYEYPQIVSRQMEKYSKLGFPKRYGLHETGMVIRRSSEDTEHFNNAWWAEVSTGSKRDQLSCDFVQFMTGIKIQQVDRAEVTVARHNKKTSVST